MTEKKKKDEPKEQPRQMQQNEMTIIPAGATLVRMEPTAIAPPPATAEELAHAAGEQIKFYQLLIQLIAKSVPLSDITLFGGRQDDPPQVWFGSNACRRILGWGRYNFKTYPVETHPYEDGSGIEFRVYGELSKGDWCVSVMGNRSTTDEFFSRAYRARCEGCDETFSKSTKQCPRCKQETVEEAYTLPLKEIDRSSVVQAAISNCWNKALGAAGLMPSYEDLEEALKAAGKDISKIKQVGFGGRREAAPDSVEVSTMRTKVFSALARACDNDKSKMADLLESLTTFTVRDGKDKGKVVKGKREVERLTEKQLPRVLEGLEKMAKGKPEPKATAKPEPKAETKASNAPAVIPDAKIFGVVTKVEGPVTSRNNRTMVIIKILPEGQEERKLYCFDNKTMQGQNGEPTKAFDLLKGAGSKYCVFGYSQQKSGENLYYQLTGIFQIGNHCWDDDGVPYVDRKADMREPGKDDPSLFD
jgi:hypothetical protein